MNTPIIDQLEYEMSDHGDPAPIIAKARELERENARLREELSEARQTIERLNDMLHA